MPVSFGANRKLKVRLGGPLAFKICGTQLDIAKNTSKRAYLERPIAVDRNGCPMIFGLQKMVTTAHARTEKPRRSRKWTISLPLGRGNLPTCQLRQIPVNGLNRGGIDPRQRVINAKRFNVSP